MDLVRQGNSWSGGERNRFFLNGAGARFYDASALAGLDHADDGRGLAVVDWDQDGRLDLWYRNRTAPRLRLMLNRRELSGEGEWLAVRLEGTSANRDAIGAVVELVAAGEAQHRLVRSVRAGDLFLSQSSKWLHFGTAGFGEIEHLDVLWPGGQRERFAGVARGSRFVLRQGTGVARAWNPGRGRRATALPVAQDAVAESFRNRDSGVARIILPARVPMPRIAFRDQAARPQQVPADGKPRLLILWSASCPHCKEQLRQLAGAEDRIRATGIDVLALSTEGMAGLTADTSAAYDLVDDVGFPFAWGLIDAASAGRIHRWQRALFDRTPASTVPLAILLDQRARAVAIRRGAFGIDQLLADWQQLRDADERQLYHLAPPMAGTWFTNPLSGADLAAFLSQLMAE